MNRFRTKGFAALVVAAVASAGMAMPPAATAYGLDDYSEEPDAAEMLADAVVVRPMSFVATAIGAVGWVVSLPFTIIGGNVEEVGQKLIVDPGRYTFVRPLGYMEEGTPPTYDIRNEFEN